MLNQTPRIPQLDNNMSLGVAIFLSSVFVGTVALFIATKDRWNWKRIFLWPLAALILIAAGLWIYNTIEQRPKVQTTFWDIRIGATEGDVKFLKGSPSDGPINKDRDEWVYVFEGSTLRERTTKEWDSIYRIRFKTGKVYLVEYRTSPNRTYGPGIQGIDIGDSLETITQKFGPPSHVSVSKDELSRVFSFNKY